jgi:hypothetical protein
MTEARNPVIGKLFSNATPPERHSGKGLLSMKP